MTCCPTCGAKLAVPKPQENDDPAWQALLAAWWFRFGARPVPARELHQLPEAQAVRSSLIAFGQRLGKAWRAGEVVNGRRVVLVEWGRTAKKKGTTVCHPTLYRLEEIDINRQVQQEVSS